MRGRDANTGWFPLMKTENGLATEPANIRGIEPLPDPPRPCTSVRAARITASFQHTYSRGTIAK